MKFDYLATYFTDPMFHLLFFRTLKMPWEPLLQDDLSCCGFWSSSVKWFVDLKSTGPSFIMTFSYPSLSCLSYRLTTFCYTSWKLASPPKKTDKMLNIYWQARRWVWEVTSLFFGAYIELMASSNLTQKKKSILLSSIFKKKWGWNDNSVLRNTCWSCRGICLR